MRVILSFKGVLCAFVSYRVSGGLFCPIRWIEGFSVAQGVLQAFMSYRVSCVLLMVQGVFCVVQRKEVVWRLLRCID